MVMFLYCLYGFLALVAAGNLALMRRPKGAAETSFEVMIPARNEAENLATLVSPLVAEGVKVTVFDDESTDGTGELAERLGADVKRPSAPLPSGWTGKNNACHQLALNSTREWVVFLDADTQPMAGFVPRLSAHLATTRASVVTGFPRMVPGEGLEPVYLGWVPWILLCTNPFGLVSATQKGHNRFTNGQFVAWRRTVLTEVDPFEQVRGEILEDVKIGRLLARLGHRVDFLNVSDILRVRMYRTLGEAFRGMCKNSADIAGSSIMSVLLALFLLVIAWAWLLGGVGCYALFVLGKALSDRITKFAPWTAVFVPITVTGAAMTILVSVAQKRKGTRSWKGRTYS